MKVEDISRFLPQVSADTAAVSRLAFDARLQRWLCGTLGQPLNVVRRIPAHGSAILEIECGEGVLHLALDSRDWPALEMALALDDDGACAVASILLAAQLQALAGALTAPRVSRRKRRSTVTSAEPITTFVAPAGHVALIRMSAPLREHLQRGVTGMPAGAMQALAVIKLRPRLVLLRRSLPADALRDLRQGDVVLFDQGQAPVFQWIFGKGMTMQTNAMMDPTGEQAVVSGDPTMAYETPAEDGPVGQLQLPVSFEVDTARISLAEMASIRPGYVIELERTLKSAAVRLVCQGQTVGHGQLVAVGEHMGVRIVRMDLSGTAA